MNLEANLNEIKLQLKKKINNDIDLPLEVLLLREKFIKKNYIIEIKSKNKNIIINKNHIKVECYN